MYKITLYINPIADKGDPLEVSYEGEDLDDLKRMMSWTILETMRVHNASDGDIYIDLFIEKNGEHYDHDEGNAFVDLKSNRIQYDI